ncbi:MAG: hypothetical protein K0U86_13110 [Planctomycetes bacterium]|nr:hypothetical protein [Planctomycetota bacterium]MCH9725829.1 hypothetical protein [Planctomycetota bacterium]MCH9775393.1 hypothetical protein [Planctomycetota bacterium]MCH9790978.1 hypothetical protein [Planctomycetota bacterium]MDF1745583.1 hypothetical protein [Gimesia sp.]
MKDLLTSTSSIIVILFCFSLLLLDEVPETVSVEPTHMTDHSAGFKSGMYPKARTTLFSRIQSVKVRNGVLMFVSLEPDGLQEHYFLIRDKNVILIKKTNSVMPADSIKFEDDGRSTMLVTISASLDIDLLEEMSRN